MTEGDATEIALSLKEGDRVLYKSGYTKTRKWLWVKNVEKIQCYEIAFTPNGCVRCEAADEIRKGNLIVLLEMEEIELDPVKYNV